MPVFAADAPYPLPRGRELARYELLCPIAEGGMACVWAARPRGAGADSLVAIKAILPGFAEDERFRQMFLHEGRVASRIVHPNVARIVELGEEHGVLYLVMEYIDGDALAKLDRVCRKAGTSLPTGIALRVLADICAGLHEAHELVDERGKPLGLVHHDVSPHNILVSATGLAKLIDFGIAKTESDRREDSFSGVLKGKIQYMAPEQALGQPMDRRADVWAVGAILYMLLAGKPPYEGRNHVAILNRLASGRPPLPLPRDVHPAVAAVARVALAHSPENRYATADQLRRALESAMIEATAGTTTADVAAFSALHLAGRVEKRRRALEDAIARGALVRNGARDCAPPVRTPQSFTLFRVVAGLALLTAAVLAGASLARVRSSRADATPELRESVTTSALAVIDESRLTALRRVPVFAAGVPASGNAPPASSAARRRVGAPRLTSPPFRSAH